MKPLPTPAESPGLSPTRDAATPPASTGHRSAAKRAPVLMFGTSLESTGGVAAVLQMYRREGLFDDENVVYIPTHVDGSAARKALTFVRAVGRLVAWLPRRPRLAHIHLASNASFWRKLAVGALCRLGGLPYILHLHGGGFRDFHAGRGRTGRASIRWLFEHAAGVIVLTPQWQDWVRSVFANARVEVIANPVALPARDARPAAREPATVLFLGRLMVGKGVRELIEAAASLASRHPQLRVVIGGDGDPAPFAARARELGIEQKVQFLGWVGPEAKDELLRSATLLALPSYNEGLPMCVLEAMAARLPVVSTRVGGIPDAVTHGVDGLLVPPRDVAALADAIDTVIGDPAMARAMADRAALKVETTYDSRLVAARVRGFYAECCETRGDA